MALVGLNKTPSEALKTAQMLKQQEESFTKAHADYMKGRSIEQMKADAQKEIEAEKAKLAEEKIKLVELNKTIQAKQDKVDAALKSIEALKADAGSLKAQAETKLKEADSELLKARQKLADAQDGELEAIAAKKLYEEKLEDIKKTLRALV